MSDQIPTIPGTSSTDALDGAEQMAAALRAAGWRVERPIERNSPRTGHVLPDGYRERVCQWVRDNGLDPGVIPVDARIEVDGDRITTEVWARNDDGKPVVSGNAVMRTRTTVPLRRPWSEFDTP